MEAVERNWQTKSPTSIERSEYLAQKRDYPKSERELNIILEQNVLERLYKFRNNIKVKKIEIGENAN